MTFRLVGPIAGPDGIDFRVLIAETQVANGLYTPTNIVYASGVYTLGPALGAAGTSVIAPTVVVNLGGLDLVDGAVYEWLLDAVTPADGIEGWGAVGYRHPALPDIPGNSSVLLWDLELETANQPWINTSNIDLAYKLTFSEGGVAVPTLPVLGTLPSETPPIPEPSEYALMLAGLAALAMVRRKAHREQAVDRLYR